MRPFISPRVVITLLEHEAVDYAGSGSGRWGGVSDNPTCTGVSTVQNHSDVSAVACGSGCNAGRNALGDSLRGCRPGACARWSPGDGAGSCTGDGHRYRECDIEGCPSTCRNGDQVLFCFGFRLIYDVGFDGSCLNH